MKRYSIEYNSFDKKGWLIKEKILKETNNYFYAKFIYRDYCKMVLDFCYKNCNLEYLIYDNKKHTVLCRFNFLLTKTNKE